VVKPCFADVYRERGEAVGVAEFESEDDMRLAIRRLDDTEFKNPFEKSYIRIVEV
jgi:arginine/serine-rich splicing factor 1/9